MALSPAMPRVAVFAFSVNSNSRGYHVYQSIWPNPSRDDELTDVRTGSQLEMLSQGVLTTVRHIPRSPNSARSLLCGGTS